jgi:hypothetical protein
MRWFIRSATRRSPSAVDDHGGGRVEAGLIASPVAVAGLVLLPGQRLGRVVAGDEEAHGVVLVVDQDQAAVGERGQAARAAQVPRHHLGASAGERDGPDGAALRVLHQLVVAVGLHEQHVVDEGQAERPLEIVLAHQGLGLAVGLDHPDGVVVVVGHVDLAVGRGQHVHRVGEASEPARTVDERRQRASRQGGHAVLERAERFGVDHGDGGVDLAARVSRRFRSLDAARRPRDEQEQARSLAHIPPPGIARAGAPPDAPSELVPYPHATEVALPGRSCGQERSDRIRRSGCARPPHPGSGA